MRRLPAAVLVCSSVALAVVSSLAPGIASAQSPTPTPSGSGSSVSPTPSPTQSSPTPSPSSPAPSPTPSPTDDTPPSDELAAVVDIQVHPSGGVAEMGDHLAYSLQVVNPGTTSLNDLVITDLVPAELDVAGVPIVDQADAINLISIGNDEQIVWTIGELEAGASISLPWDASVSSTGDLVAENEVTAATEDTSGAASRNVYLARNSAPVVQGGTSTAARPATETRKVVRYEQRRVPAGSAPAAVLPMSGAIVWGWFVLGVILIGAGLVLYRIRRSSLVPCLLVGLVVLAACTSTTPQSAGTPESDKTATPSTDGSNEGDEVLGKRIHRGDDEPSSPEEPSEEPSDGTDGVAAEIPVPQEDLVRVVSIPVEKIVQVPAQPITETLTNLDGDNLISFSWDESSRSLSDAASSRTLSRDATAELLAELATATPTIAPTVELVNLSEGTLVVSGELGIRTLGPAGESAATTSEHVDIVLEPGGSVALDFEYVLPSGDYTSAAFFQAD